MTSIDPTVINIPKQFLIEGKWGIFTQALHTLHDNGIWNFDDVCVTTDENLIKIYVVPSKIQEEPPNPFVESELEELE